LKRTLWSLVCLVSCGSRTPLPELHARDAAGPTDGSPDGIPPSVPGCFGAGETLLATGEFAPTSIAVDATHVYWAISGHGCSDGAIRRMPKAGGEIQTLAPGQPNPRALVVDTERVHFLNGCGTGLLRSVPKQGGPIADHPTGLGPFHDARALAQDAENLYFNDYGVLRIEKAGGPPIEVDNHDYVYGLAADDSAVHWIGPIGGGPSYGVFRWAQGDPGATLLAEPTDVGSGIALDASFVYFAGGIGIQRIARTGGVLELVIAADPWQIAVDAESVYWTEGFLGSGGHSIRKVSKALGEEQVLATGDGAYVTLAVDDRCVYWADLYGHVIGRVPK
jgi:hypothetical protein